MVTEKRRPVLLVEAKAGRMRVAPALRKFQDRLRVPALQLTNEGAGFRRISNGAHTIVVAPAYLWVPRLP